MSMNDLINIGFGDAAVTALLGYIVVFFGLVLLMFVVMLMGRLMSEKKAQPAPEPVPEPVKAEPAPGSAGELKLYDTDPRDAAMIMAIVADTLGKPINELRFISIREVKE
ncbi:MAG: OadG family protein [Oscillospiraceae bacterium]|nr:OadG family protein [Oscillospiraceae bacterium]